MLGADAPLTVTHQRGVHVGAAVLLVVRAGEVAPGAAALGTTVYGCT